MFCARHKAQLNRDAFLSGNQVYLYAIEVLPFADTVAPPLFPLQQLTAADADVVAHLQGKGVYDVLGLTAYVLEPAAQMQEQPQHQGSQPVQPFALSPLL